MNAFDLAAQQIGLNETDQKAALTEYLQNGGQNLDPATTAWCAAFVDATLQQSGQSGTGKLNARSYLNWGNPVDTPRRGDIAVFSRGDPNGWQGHVGFYDGTNPDGSIRVLGGNQSDSVNVANYSAKSLLGYRRGGEGGMPSVPRAAMQTTYAPLPAPSMQPESRPQSNLTRLASMPKLAPTQPQGVQQAQPFGLRQGSDGLLKFVLG